MSTEQQIWTDGRRGAVVCITATIYEYKIVASAEADQITAAMMVRALHREFPRHTFHINEECEFLFAVADRWTDDGLDE